MKFFGRFKKKPEPEYVVQLHRVRVVYAGPDETRGELQILGSWAPITVRGEENAEIAAARLRQDNLWGGPDFFPHVTITKTENGT